MRIAEILPFLSPSVARHTLDSLFSVLPAPVPDTPAARDARDATAISWLLALRPENAADAMLAVRIIAADAHAMDCLRRSNQPGVPIDEFLRWGTLAASMMRTANSSRSLLLRIQNDRAKAAAKARAPARSSLADGKSALPGHPSQGKPPSLH